MAGRSPTLGSSLAAFPRHEPETGLKVGQLRHESMIIGDGTTNASPTCYVTMLVQRKLLKKKFSYLLFHLF